MNLEKVLNALVDAHNDNLLIINPNYKIIYANDRVKSNLKENLIDKSIFDIFLDIRKEESLVYNSVITKKPIIETRKICRLKGDKKAEFKVSVIPIVDNSKIFGIIIIFRKLKKDYSPSLTKAIYSNGTRYVLSDILGESKDMKLLKKKILKIHKSHSPVFVYGQTGTGKELVVQSIHNSSGRSNNPFIAQNCAALPENLLESILFGTVEGSFTGAKDKPGLFELADGGTLFLDEINSMDINLQSKLLRVLEDGVVRRLGDTETKLVDVRIIAASNTCPIELVKTGKLREDLYYRLNVIYFEVPPLKERKQDLFLLVDKFIKDNNLKMEKNIKGLDNKVLDYFLEYDWPGNVRELENIIESAMNFVEGDYISLEDIKINSRFIRTDQVQLEDLDYTNVDLNKTLEKYERHIIEEAIKKADYNCAAAARNLNIPKQTLYSKLKRYGIKY